MRLLTYHDPTTSRDPEDYNVHNDYIHWPLLDHNDNNDYNVYKRVLLLDYLGYHL